MDGPRDILFSWTNIIHYSPVTSKVTFSGTEFSRIPFQPGQTIPITSAGKILQAQIVFKVNFQGLLEQYLQCSAKNMNLKVNSHGSANFNRFLGKKLCTGWKPVPSPFLPHHSLNQSLTLLLHLLKPRKVHLRHSTHEFRDGSVPSARVVKTIIFLFWNGAACLCQLLTQRDH